MIRDLLLVFAVIALMYSYVSDRSMKDVIENPPAEVLDFLNDGTDAAVDTAGDVAARIEQAAKEQAADLDEIEVSIDEALETAGRIEQAIDEVEIPDVVKETATDSKARMEQATE